MLAEREIEVLKKQAAAQSTEYERLQEENKSLRLKLEDFELVLPNNQKKNA